MRRFLVELVLFCGLALVLVALARADDGPNDLHYPALDKLASYWAGHPVIVDCPTPEDWADDSTAEGAWAYTYLESDWTRMDPQLCDAALQVQAGQTGEPWLQALSVLVITHEAFHLREWEWNGDEGRVECQAIRHWPESFLLLAGWNVPLFKLLLPWALVEHFHIAARFAEYNYRGCRIPYWPPWRH